MPLQAYSPSRVLTAAYAALDLLAQSLLFFFGDRLWANKHSRMVVGYTACTAVTAALPLVSPHSSSVHQRYSRG